ncbi:2'-5' RNA ligase family protein [Halobacillus salinus]|uniref:2'-5' RNA ligase family protein n=1 Tax=Halobacillus salinus TaxID=192814 RepID=A0A4Z0H399_9BACI|nr:2'-5' RNA ligase family protein [Halobacillus salinus]TGB04863.1 2'-5' RNA ligase family protein [Halobacillus salinus]
MENQYFIGIVPPENIFNDIDRFRKKWLTQINSEPHITLKAQGGLTSDKKWIEQVKSVCRNFDPFPLTLEEPSYFSDNILYLSVQSSSLHDLHEKLVHAISPPANSIKQYFELNDFVPHLTLGKKQFGLTKRELQHMEESARKELTPFDSFDVTYIRIYERFPSDPVYKKLVDVPLG